jgi:hypothetical protein
MLQYADASVEAHHRKMCLGLQERLPNLTDLGLANEVSVWESTYGYFYIVSVLQRVRYLIVYVIQPHWF